MHTHGFPEAWSCVSKIVVSEHFIGTAMGFRRYKGVVHLYCSFPFHCFSHEVWIFSVLAFRVLSANCNLIDGCKEASTFPDKSVLNPSWMRPNLVAECLVAESGCSWLTPTLSLDVPSQYSKIIQYPYCYSWQQHNANQYHYLIYSNNTNTNQLTTTRVCVADAHNNPPFIDYLQQPPEKTKETIHQQPRVFVSSTYATIYSHRPRLAITTKNIRTIDKSIYTQNREY